MRILLVEDHPQLAESVAQAMRAAGWTVDLLHDGVAADLALASEDYALAILDVGLPRLDGFQVLARLRERGKTLPVLMLTARGEVSDRVHGLNLGADDYLAKPFEPRELVLRINSILRRLAPPPPRAAGTIRLGGFTFDIERGELLQEGERVRLTTGEENLLRILAQHAGETVSREALTESGTIDGGVRAVDVQVTRLRRKIEPDPRLPRYLHTVRGEGYVLRPDG